MEFEIFVQVLLTIPPAPLQGGWRRKEEKNEKELRVVLSL